MRSLNALDESAMTIKARIAILWASATLLYLYGDVIAFYVPGSLQKISDGKLGDWTVTPTWLLAVAVLMSTPALMGALTVVLKPVASRWLNVVMGAAYSAVILFTMIGAWESGLHFYIYLGVVEVLVTLLIVWYALTWPRQPLMTTASASPGAADMSGG
jgi:hypothetical protein